MSQQKKSSQSVQSLIRLASRSIPSGSLSDTQLLDLLETNKSLPMSAYFYANKASAQNRSIPRTQVQEKAREKKFKIFSDIKRKERSGFDMFPLFFLDLPWVQGGDLLFQSFGDYVNNTRREDIHNSLYYIGKHSRFHWFIVNYYNDTKKKIFVLYESPVVLPTDLFNVDLTRENVSDSRNVQKLRNFFRTARLIGVYPVDFRISYDFVTERWIQNRLSPKEILQIEREELQRRRREERPSRKRRTTT